MSWKCFFYRYRSNQCFPLCFKSAFMIFPFYCFQSISQSPSPLSFIATSCELKRIYIKYYPMITIPQHNLLQNYRIIRPIAAGTYAQVFQALDLTNNQPVALKKMLHHENQGPGMQATSLREISVLKSLLHQNIIKLRGVILNQPHLYVVLQLQKCDLHSYLMGYQDEPLPQYEIKKLMFQMVRAIAYCHKNKIIHRDLKPQNILIDQTRNLKITDFGLARKLFYPTRPYTIEVVTLPYRAPQLLLGQTEYNEKVDIWSIGCIFAEMITKRIFFPSNGELDQLDCIFRKIGTPTEEDWPRWKELLRRLRMRISTQIDIGIYQATPLMEHIGEDCMQEAGFNLLEKMLTCNPDKRISAKEALSHPYFNDV